MTQTTFFEEPETQTASTSSNLDRGYSFEPLGLAWLLRNGHDATIRNGQTASDIWLAWEKWLCRINVKSSSETKDGMVRGLVCGGRETKVRYEENEVDIIMLFYCDSVWPLFFHITDDDRKHVSAEPKMFTEENSLKTFERAFQKFKERKCQ